MGRKKWRDLSPTTRKAIVIVGAVEAALKVVALVDLSRRPAAKVRGSKAAWATTIVVVNSAGIVPLAYFFYGRNAPTPHIEDAAAIAGDD